MDDIIRIRIPFDNDKLAKFYLCLLAENKMKVKQNPYHMIDFSEFRNTDIDRGGKFEDWLQDVFEAIFSVEGNQKFEEAFDLDTRIALLDLMISMFSFYDEDEKMNFCEKLQAEYIEIYDKMTSN